MSEAVIKQLREFIYSQNNQAQLTLCFFYFFT